MMSVATMSKKCFRSLDVLLKERLLFTKLQFLDGSKNTSKLYILQKI